MLLLSLSSLWEVCLNWFGREVRSNRRSVCGRTSTRRALVRSKDTNQKKGKWLTVTSSYFWRFVGRKRYRAVLGLSGLSLDYCSYSNTTKSETSRLHLFTIDLPTSVITDGLKSSPSLHPVSYPQIFENPEQDSEPRVITTLKPCLVDWEG